MLWLLYILTSTWVLRIPNAIWKSFFHVYCIKNINKRIYKQEISGRKCVFCVSTLLLVKVFFPEKAHFHRQKFILDTNRCETLQICIIFGLMCLKPICVIIHELSFVHSSFYGPLNCQHWNICHGRFPESKTKKYLGMVRCQKQLSWSVGVIYSEK